MHQRKLFFVILLTAFFLLITGIMTTPLIAHNIKKSVSTSITLLSSYIGGENRICCGNENDQQRPAMVYNRYHQEYFEVHHEVVNTRGLISGARVGLDGWAYQQFLITEIGEYNCCMNADVALNRTNDEYLVVWQQYNTSANKWEIYGRFIPGSGDPFTKPQFLIAQWSGMNLMIPKVAWNSYRNEYLVIWHTESTSNNSLLGIGRRRLGSGGAYLSNADFITQSNFPGYPDIAYNPAADQYVVVWSQVGASSIDVYGGKVNYAGTLQGSVFAIGAGANEQQFPAITTNEQNRYLVVWQDDRLVAADWDIYGQFLDGNANPVGGNTWFDVSNTLETHPAVTVNGVTQEYLIVYQKSATSGEGIWGHFIDENGVSLNWFEINPGGLGDNAHPAVATHLAGYFVTYEWAPWGPNSVSDIYGRQWSPLVVYLPAVLK